MAPRWWSVSAPAAPTYHPGSLVWQVTPQREVWFSEGGRSHQMRAEAVIVATGAMERPVPVPGWTLPGVMTAGAVQIMLKSSGVVPDAIVCDGGLRAAAVPAGAAMPRRRRSPAAVLDTTSRANEWRALRHLPERSVDATTAGTILAKGLAMIAALRRSGVPRFRHVSDIRIEAPMPSPALLPQWWHGAPSRHIGSSRCMRA